MFEKIKEALEYLDSNPTADEAQEVRRAAQKELKRAEKIVRHARQIFIDGQLDKYPTSDASDEYHLWRLVKKENE